MRHFIFLFFLFSLSHFAQAQRAKKVFAHYLPWYDATGLVGDDRTGWCYEGDCTDSSIKHYSNEPRIGEYTQFDDDVLEYHILSAYVAGIDGFIVNLNPQWTLQKDITIQLLNRINTLKTSYPAFDFKIIISYDNSTTNQTDITTYLTYIHDNIYNHASYSGLMFEDDATNVPVFKAWSEADPQHYWNTTQTLFSNNVTFLLRNATSFDYSDGNFEWVGNLNTGMPMNNSTNWGEQYFEDFDWIMARQLDFGLMNGSSVNLVKMGGVYPGFDDQNVPSFWNGGVNRYILRTVDAGETMSLTWDKQINYTPKRLGGVDCVENPWIQIITWNDWPEGTSIEPARDATYGYTPLETCRTKIATFKGISPAYANNCLQIPYIIYQNRKAGLNTQANTAVSNLISGDCAAALAVLPLELLYFQVSCKEHFLMIQWSTIQEDQIRLFELEGSISGTSWMKVLEAHPKGNLNFESTYSFPIENEENFQYFRLKIIDQDGSVTFSKMVENSCPLLKQEILLYPNPTSENLKIKASAGSGFLKVIDLQGRVLHVENKIPEKEQLLPLKDLNLNSGQYFIQIFSLEGQLIGIEKFHFIAPKN